MSYSQHIKLNGTRFGGKIAKKKTLGFCGPSTTKPWLLMSGGERLGWTLKLHA